MDMKNSGDKYRQKRILVVEDEADIVRLLSFHLEKEGYRVVSAGSGRDALTEALENPPDLIILDIMLPEMDGLEVCRRLRGNDKTAFTPVLILSAKKEEIDRVLGLELGADDYMVKPFSMRELLARVKAMLRRLEHITTFPADTGSSEEKEQEAVLKAGRITLYPERHQVFIDDQLCNLTHKEFVLLHLLMTNPGRVMTREVLLDRVWGYEMEVDTRTVDVHVRYLRQKIEEDPAKPRLIETVRGVGYRFTGSPE